MKLKECRRATAPPPTIFHQVRGRELVVRAFLGWSERAGWHNGMIETPGAANYALRILSKLMAFAIENAWRASLAVDRRAFERNLRGEMELV